MYAYVCSYLQVVQSAEIMPEENWTRARKNKGLGYPVVARIISYVGTELGRLWNDCQVAIIYDVCSEPFSAIKRIDVLSQIRTFIRSLFFLLFISIRLLRHSIMLATLLRHTQRLFYGGTNLRLANEWQLVLPWHRPFLLIVLALSSKETWFGYLLGSHSVRLVCRCSSQIIIYLKLLRRASNI